ncbi:hypothetical protein BHE74_00008478 [Ensete ventricosum]|nr:hypothetical protein BHE74_00008478 [Ensete ventricosum]RZR77259.1 hypothetical protein BHM03_00002272 [Ensete ventricosum]
MSTAKKDHSDWKGERRGFKAHSDGRSSAPCSPPDAARPRGRAGSSCRTPPALLGSGDPPRRIGHRRRRRSPGISSRPAPVNSLVICTLSPEAGLGGRSRRRWQGVAAAGGHGGRIKEERDQIRISRF